MDNTATATEAVDAKKVAEESMRAAIIFLLCAPSELNLAWARPDHELAKNLTVDGVLNALGVPAETQAFAKQFLDQLSGEKPVFAAMAGRMRVNNVWPTEPHPPTLIAQGVVAKLLAT